MDKKVIHFLNEQSKGKSLSDSSTGYVESTTNAIKPIVEFYTFLKSIDKERANFMLKSVISGIAFALTEKVDGAYNLLNEAKQMLVEFEKEVNKTKK